MFCSGPDGLRWVRERLLRGEEATLAVAFWGYGASEQLGLAARPSRSPGVRVILNLAMGGTNPHEVRRFALLPDISVEQSDRLHGKVYLFKDAVMIGSSNASANGLSFEGEASLGWDEANYVSTNPKDLAAVRNWISKLSIRPIQASDLDQAIAIWSARRQAMPTSRPSMAVLNLLSGGPSGLLGPGRLCRRLLC